jgi:hypothetical protein
MRIRSSVAISFGVRPGGSSLQLWFPSSSPFEDDDVALGLGMQTSSPQRLIAQRIRRLILQGTVAQGGARRKDAKKDAFRLLSCESVCGKYSVKNLLVSGVMCQGLDPSLAHVANCSRMTDKPEINPTGRETLGQMALGRQTCCLRRKITTAGENRQRQRRYFCRFGFAFTPAFGRVEGFLGGPERPG